VSCLLIPCVVTLHCASLNSVHDIATFSTLSSAFCVSLQLHAADEWTLLTKYTHTHTHTHMDCAVEVDGSIVLVIDE